MLKRLLAAGVLAGAAVGASAQTLDSLRAMAAAPAAEVASPAAPAPAADPAVEKVWETMLAGLSPERRRFMLEHVSVVVYPRETNVADRVAAAMQELFPPEEAAARIAHLRAAYARRAESGPVERVPQLPRGSTIDFPGDRTISFVGAENLGDGAEWDPNGSRRWRLPVHELGHAVHRTFTAEEWAVLKKLAMAYYSNRPDPRDNYRDGDEQEMFAEFTEVWFGVHQTDLRVKGWDAASIPENLKPMATFLEYVYGPARNVRPQ